MDCSISFVFSNLHLRCKQFKKELVAILFSFNKALTHLLTSPCSREVPHKVKLIDWWHQFLVSYTLLWINAWTLFDLDWLGIILSFLRGTIIVLGLSQIDNKVFWPTEPETISTLKFLDIGEYFVEWGDRKSRHLLENIQLIDQSMLPISCKLPSLDWYWTTSLTILWVNFQIAGLGPAVACLVGTRCAISTFCLFISTPEALRRLMHKDVVADADSRESISGRPTI